MSRGRPIALAAVLAVLLLAAAAGGCNRGGATAPAGPEAVPVAVARAERRNVPVRLRAIGNVEATSTVSIRPRAGGEVVQVAFEEGKDVRRGDLLFVIDPEPYRVAVAEAEARLARDEALLRKAEQDERRYAGLVEKDYVTKEQFDQVQANRSALRATIRGDQAALDAARIELGYCTIRSPIDGRAGTLLVHRGNLVKQNDDQPLVVLLQTRPIFVGFSVPEQYLPEIRRRAAAGPLEVTATVTAAAAAAGEQPHVGRLDFVDNAVDAATGTIRLKATFENEDRALWPGQFLDVRLTLSDEKPTRSSSPTPRSRRASRGPSSSSWTPPARPSRAP